MKTYKSSIDLTEEQRKKVRILAALKNMTMGQYLVSLIEREYDKFNDSKGLDTLTS